jgi:hypothetical protein
MVGVLYGWSTCRDKFVTSTLQSESEFVNYWSELFDSEWTETGSHVCGDVLSFWTLCLIGVELCIGLRTPLGDSGGNSLMSSMQIGLQLLASSLSTRGTKWFGAQLLELPVAVFEWVHIITNSLLDFEILGLNVVFKI